jgi:hypothetical protein
MKQRNTTLEKKIRKNTGLFLKGKKLIIIHYSNNIIVTLSNGNTTIVLFFKVNMKYNKSKGESKYSLTKKKIRISNN